MKKLINWDDFEKIDMRVGTIIKAVEFKKAINPSYLIHVDFGEIGIKKTSWYWNVSLELVEDEFEEKRFISPNAFGPPPTLCNELICSIFEVFFCKVAPAHPSALSYFGLEIPSI